MFTTVKVDKVTRLLNSPSGNARWKISYRDSNGVKRSFQSLPDTDKAIGFAPVWVEGKTVRFECDAKHRWYDFTVV